jgi:hypothetical protein
LYRAGWYVHRANTGCGKELDRQSVRRENFAAI